MEPQTPWDVYAHELMRLWHGYPLWDPEPVNQGSEILIGDVGFLYTGSFRPFFNILPPGTFHDEIGGSDRAAADRLHPEGTPLGFEPFSTSNITFHERRDGIKPGLYGAKSVVDINVSANVSVNTATSTGSGGLQFEFTEDRGAGLIIWEHANRKELMRSRRLCNYIIRNHKRWYDYITVERDIVCPKLEDIIIISGWVKTGSWATTAYVSGGKGAQVSLNGGWNGVSLNVSASGSKRTVTPPAYKTGPCVHHVEGRRDQSVFIRYYKVRWRLAVWPKVMEAAADPEDLLRHPDDAEGAAASIQEEAMEVEQMPKEPEGYDPVGDILTYILENSEAQKAIASVDDVYDLCKDEGVPSDILGMLRHKRPMIDVTEEGLGMLAFDQLGSYESDTLEEHVAAPSTAHGNDNRGALEPAQDTSEPVQEPEQVPESDRERTPDRRTVAPPAPGNIPHSTSQPRGEDAKEGKGGLVILNDDNTGGVGALAISPDGSCIATGSFSFAVVLWDTASGDRIRELKRHKSTVCALSFSSDGQFLVSGSRDSRAIVWHVKTGELLHILEGHDKLVNTVLFSPDSSIIATGSADSTIRLWNMDGTLRGILRGHIAVVLLLSFSSDSRNLVSASADYTARLWSTAPGIPTSTQLEGHEGIICCITFSPDNRKIVTGSDDGSTRIWSAESSEELVALHEHTGSVWAAVFSPDNRRVLSIASDGCLKICDTFSGELISSMEVSQSYNSSINAAAFSRDTKMCVTAADMTVKVWSTETGECVATMDGHQDGVTHVWFSPNGESVVSASDDGTFRVWNVQQHSV